MVSELELLAAVDAAFGVASRGLAHWPDPHPDRSPRDEEYSRLTDPARWRLVGARADAWLTALAGAGLADVERDVVIGWPRDQGPTVSRADRAVPRAAGAIPLVVGRSRLGELDDAGVTLGAGDPAVVMAWVPDCGCDACDSGSQDALDELDEYVVAVVSGRFRRLHEDDPRTREITVLGDRIGWRARGPGGFRRDEVEAILGDPVGWHEVSGASWLAAS